LVLFILYLSSYFYNLGITIYLLMWSFDFYRDYIVYFDWIVLNLDAENDFPFKLCNTYFGILIFLVDEWISLFSDWIKVSGW
jgi:hypothetical protein